MALANFAASLKPVLAHEGGYSNQKADPGGATYRGVTWKVYNAFRKARGLPQRDVREMTDDELQAIYRRNYWDKVGGDELPRGVDYCVFDAGVNSGPVQGVKWLQRALEIPADGNAGYMTMTAAGQADPVRLIDRICDNRLAFLKSLKTWPTFGVGWGRRVTDVRKTAKAMVRSEPEPEPVVQDADDMAKAPTSETRITTTPAGQATVQQTTAGIVSFLSGIVSQISDALGGLTGINPEVIKAVAIAVAILGILAMIGFAGYALWRVVLKRRQGDVEAL